MTLIITNRSAIAYELRWLRKTPANSFIRDRIAAKERELYRYDQGKYRRISVNTDKLGSFNVGTVTDRGTLVASYDGTFYSYSDWFLKVTADIRRFNLVSYIHEICFVSDCGIDLETICVEENHPDGPVCLYRCWLNPEKERVVEWTIRGKILDWYENRPDVRFNCILDNALKKSIRRKCEEEMRKKDVPISTGVSPSQKQAEKGIADNQHIEGDTDLTSESITSDK